MQAYENKQFNNEELKLLSDCCHFTRACIERDSVSLFSEISALITIVDKLVKEGR